MREMGKVYICPKSGKHTEVKSALPRKTGRQLIDLTLGREVLWLQQVFPAEVMAPSASPAPSLTREKKKRADKEVKALPALERSQSAVSTEILGYMPPSLSFPSS